MGSPTSRFVFMFTVAETAWAAEMADEMAKAHVDLEGSVLEYLCKVQVTRDVRPDEAVPDVFQITRVRPQVLQRRVG